MVAAVGPVVDVQETPLTPAILHVPIPVGAWPVVGPLTVAVKVKVDPNETLVALVVTRTVGINLVMTMVAVLLAGPAR